VGVVEVVLPLLPGLEEEVDGAGHDEQEAVGHDIASCNYGTGIYIHTYAHVYTYVKVKIKKYC
jgi:hypothetical protein